MWMKCCLATIQEDATASAKKCSYPSSMTYLQYMEASKRFKILLWNIVRIHLGVTKRVKPPRLGDVSDSLAYPTTEQQARTYNVCVWFM